VGGGGATGALDRGWEAAEAAHDGEQELRAELWQGVALGKKKGNGNVSA
jgi:hypothetical protein